MLAILTTTDHQEDIENAIASVERLDELVSLVPHHNGISPQSKVLLVQDDSLIKPLDWHDTEPPYIIPPVNFSTTNLLALVFYSLNNLQKAFEYLTEEDPLYQHFCIATNIRYGNEIDEQHYTIASASKHNLCMIHHYTHSKNRFSLEKLKKNYRNTIETATDNELKIFTAKHYINLLIDTQGLLEAETLINSLRGQAISVEAINTLNVQLATVMMHQLKIPFNEENLEIIQDLFQKGIAFYEERNLKINSGLLLIDAAEIANYHQKFIESKNYINKAIAYFKEENIPEFLGEATFRKGVLLYTWSKNGQPHYYKAAINTFQNALKVFKRDIHPKKFAEIHHNMALIYAEIPVSPEEKPMWTAFCAASFKEALTFYTKDQYPYENAMVNHNYATALINFPQAKRHNNLDKAFNLFEKALSIRTAEKYPFERASTLLNQLELYWLLNNENNADETKKLHAMRTKIKEVKTLVNDTEMLEKTAFYESKLEALKTVL